MNLLRYIFGRVAVVDIRFLPDGTTDKRVFLCRRNGDALLSEEPLNVLAKRYATVAVCSGAGVISRPLRGDAAEARIKSDGGEFVWNETDNGISFMRRDAFAAAIPSMNDDAVLQRIYCDLSPTEAARRFRESVAWRDVFRIDDRGSALCLSIAKRAMLPVLMTYLVAVAAGTVLRSRYDSRGQALQAELASLDAARRSASASSAEYDRMAGAFAQRLPMKYSVMCDRIGAGVPNGIRLTALDIEPLSKRYKVGETLRRTERLVALTGRCSEPSSVVVLTDYLSEQRLFAGVELRSITRTRDGDMEFKIEMRL